MAKIVLKYDDGTGTKKRRLCITKNTEPPLVSVKVSESKNKFIT